ncbi:MAG: 6-carboxytetrahydropterin synthase [Phycisphaerales bacterium]
MYQLEIRNHFSAAHAITMGGVVEPLHGHDWHVTVVVEGKRLDDDGLLVDFHKLQSDLASIIGPFQNQNLNEVEPFSLGLNPTAEHVATHIWQSLSDRLATWSQNASKDSLLPPCRLRIASVRVTEAVGCAATYAPAVNADPDPLRP